MSSNSGRPRRIAVLVDAENVSPCVADAVFADVATRGEAIVRRAYGDFSGGHLKGWVAMMAAYAIIPHQSFASTAGKNAADIALTIDAMDLLHTTRLDAFCLVSSDGDFTRLAARIREHGLEVYGYGERKAPEAFRQACREFRLVDEAIASSAVAAPPANGTAAELAREAVEHLRTAVAALTPTDGWYPLEALGSRLAAEVPGFKPRAYACPKLLTLVERSAAFDIRREKLKVFVRPNDGAALR